MDDKTTRKEGKTERKKKRVGNTYLDKRNYCVGTEPYEYIGILVTSTITGHGGSVVSALHKQKIHKQKVVHIPVVPKFFSNKYFYFFPFQPLSDHTDKVVDTPT